MALNTYGYRENNEMSPYQPNSAVDERQDREIATKADTSEVTEWINTLFDEMNSGLTIVTEQITNNANNIAELSGKIEDEREWVDENYVSKDRLTGVVGILSGAIDTLSGYTEEEIGKIWDAIGGEESGSTALAERVENLENTTSDIIERVERLEGTAQEHSNAIAALEGEKASTCWVEETFATKEELSDEIDVLEDEISAITDDISDLSDTISEEIERSVAADEELSTRIANEEEAVSALDEKIEGEISARTSADESLSERIDNEETARISADNEISGMITTAITSIEDRLEADEMAVAEFEELTDNKFTTQQAIIDTLRTEMGEKASADDVEELTGRVEALEEEVGTLATKDALDDVIGDVDALSAALETKADAADVNDIVEDIADINDTLAGKASQTSVNVISDNLSSLSDDIANNYLTKEEASNTYPVKAEVVVKSEFDDKISEIESLVSDAASKGELNNEKNARISGDAALDDRMTTIYENVASSISNTNQRVTNLASIVSDNTEAIDKNRTNISLISELKNTESGVADYDDSGNGILDVLHREYHNVMDGTYSGIEGLINYIKSLEDRIAALENQ